jgi:sec-independent protein translocase protein TatA
MFGLGPWELGIILVIVLIIFGAGKLPDIGAIEENKKPESS